MPSSGDLIAHAAVDPALQNRRDFPTSRIAVLIPAYDPDSAFGPLIGELSACGFGAIIVVDDGSDPSHQPTFRAVAAIPGCEVLRHAVNLGKGRALKTGFNHFLLRYPAFDGIVTADADGQHTAEGILGAARRLSSETGKLILGCRSFEGQVPFRSRLGNVLTKWIFGFMTGRAVGDTQSGLRGIPAALVPKLLRVEGERYEYEMNMLADAATSSGIVEFPIETVYIDGNRSSHFNPIWDSMRIYFVLARFVFSSLLAAAMDFVVFSLVFWATRNLVAAVAAGRAASLVNFFINRRFVFRSQNGLTTALARYYALVALLGVASYSGIHYLSYSLGVPVIAAKLLVETTLWAASFSIQRTFVFVNRPSEREG